MSEARTRVTELIRAHLCGALDSALGAHGFTRRSRAMMYSRAIRASVQRIDLRVQMGPLDDRQAVACLYPWMSIDVAVIEEQVRTMLQSRASSLILEGSATWSGPMDFVRIDDRRARWFMYSTDREPEWTASAIAFVLDVAVPFLNAFTCPEDVCAAIDRGDQRVIKGDGTALRIPAALVLCNRPQDALAYLMNALRRAGPRRAHAQVFEYLEERAARRRA